MTSRSFDEALPIITDVSTNLDDDIVDLTDENDLLLSNESEENELVSDENNCMPFFINDIARTYREESLFQLINLVLCYVFGVCTLFCFLFGWSVLYFYPDIGIIIFLGGTAGFGFLWMVSNIFKNNNS